jgi:uncharacterized protein (TIGR03435 family)
LRGKITLPVLANYLSGVVRRLVSDQTGLSELYDLDLNYSAEEAQSADLSAAPGILTAVQEQLGFKLESRKPLFDMIIVDHVEKLPVEN